MYSPWGHKELDITERLALAQLIHLVVEQQCPKALLRRRCSLTVKVVPVFVTRSALLPQARADPEGKYRVPADLHDGCEEI